MLSEVAGDARTICFVRWEADALCGREDPETFFPVTVDIERRAKALCRGCPVRRECLADALASRAYFGIWGGMNERERRRLIRANPGVRDWGHWLAILAEQEAAPASLSPRRAAV